MMRAQDLRNPGLMWRRLAAAWALGVTASPAWSEEAPKAPASPASPSRAESSPKPEASPPPPPAPAVAPERIEELVRRLGAKYYDEREAAKEALAAVGAPAEAALVKALNHENDHVRRSACAVLGRLKSAAAVPRLIELLQEAECSDAAREALGQIGAPAYEAVRKAQRDGKLPEDAAAAILEGGVQRIVEEKLNACISKDLGYGFYKDQFKDIVALGPPATQVLLKLFTTPEVNYAFAYTFDDEPNERRVQQRKWIVRHLAGEALADMKDASVIPSLKTFADSIGKGAPQTEGDSQDERDTQDEGGPWQELSETAAFTLMKLGDSTSYQNLKADFLRSSGATVDASGTLHVPLEGVEGKRRRQVLEQAVAVLQHARSNETAESERAYEKAAELARGLTPEPPYMSKLKDVAQSKQADARAQACGELQKAVQEEEAKVGRVFSSLSRLAMLQIKADDLSGTERTYLKIIEFATLLKEEADVKVFDEDKDGALSDAEKAKREEAVEQGRWGPYFGVLRNAHYNLACAYAQMNRKAEAVASLLKAVKAGYEDAEWIKRDRDLDAIRDERDYKNLIRSLERKRQRQEERNP